MKLLFNSPISIVFLINYIFTDHQISFYIFILIIKWYDNVIENSYAQEKNDYSEKQSFMFAFYIVFFD